MKISDLKDLIGFRSIEIDRERRRLNACLTVRDFSHQAQRVLPRAVADYVDGGADEQLSLEHNQNAYRQWYFHPKSLVDVSSPNLTTTLLGEDISFPVGLAPTGYTRMIDTRGESAVAAAAEDANVPYALSTMASTSIEKVRATAPRANLWFQLYVWKDRGMVREMLTRAALQGYTTLEIAVDTTVPGARLRDIRNGMTIPPRLSLSSLGGIVRKPRYWGRMLREPKLEFANVTRSENNAQGGYTIADITRQFDSSLDWKDIEYIRSQWNGPIVLKGPINPTDAQYAQRIGINGVHLSNHGGRQLDRTIPPVDTVRAVRASIGDDMTILVDSGIRHGADVATALALGADAAFIGRPYLWGLVVGGQAGVAQVLSLLQEELKRTMQLLGVVSIAELKHLGPELLSQRAKTLNHNTSWST